MFVISLKNTILKNMMLIIKCKVIFQILFTVIYLKKIK